MFPIHTVEIPHPAHIPRREAIHILIAIFEMLSCCDSGTLFRAGANQTAKFTV